MAYNTNAVLFKGAGASIGQSQISINMPSTYEAVQAITSRFDKDK